MHLFSDMVPIYSTDDLSKMYSAKDYLSQHGIVAFDTTTSSTKRLAKSNFAGGAVALTRDGTIREFFELSVSRKDLEKAKIVMDRYAERSI